MAGGGTAVAWKRGDGLLFFFFKLRVAAGPACNVQPRRVVVEGIHYGLRSGQTETPYEKVFIFYKRPTIREKLYSPVALIPFSSVRRAKPIVAPLLLN